MSFAQIKTSATRILQDYWTDLRSVAIDSILPYRHFLHWNISKIVLFLYANIGGFILSIPFIAGIVWQYFTVYSALGRSIWLYTFIAEHFWSILLTAALFFCIVTIFVVMYTYSYFLLMRVYRGYTEGVELPYRKNLYFSWGHFRTYMGIVGWVGLYLLMPLGVLLAIVLPFAIAIWMSAFESLMQFSDGNMVVGALSIIIVAGCALWFFYLMIRLMFAPYIFSDSDDLMPARETIRSSLILTKGRVWKTLLLMFPIFFVIGMITGVFESIEHSVSLERTKSRLTLEQAREGVTDRELIQKYVYMDADVREDFAKLAVRYPEQKNHINEDFLSDSLEYMDLSKIDPNAWRISAIFIILSYLLLEWIGSMVYYGVFRALKKGENR